MDIKSYSVQAALMSQKGPWAFLAVVDWDLDFERIGSGEHGYLIESLVKNL